MFKKGDLVVWEGDTFVVVGTEGDSVYLFDDGEGFKVDKSELQYAG